MTKHIPKWVLKHVGKIILDVAETAEKQPGKVINCSSVALRGWADAYIQLEARLEEIARIVANNSKAPEHRVALEQLLTIGRIALDIEDTSVVANDGAE